MASRRSNGAPIAKSPKRDRETLMPAIEIEWNDAVSIGEADGDQIGAFVLDTEPLVVISFCEYKHPVAATPDEAELIAAMLMEGAKVAREVEEWISKTPAEK